MVVGCGGQTKHGYENNLRGNLSWRLATQACLPTDPAEEKRHHGRNRSNHSLQERMLVTRVWKVIMIMPKENEERPEHSIVIEERKDQLQTSTISSYSEFRKH